MPAVRAEILRKFYARAWGDKVKDAEVEGKATFDEYHALERVQYPGIDRHTAAANSTIPRFHKLAEDIEPESPPVVRYPPSIQIGRKPALDLADADVPKGTGKLIVARVKALRSFAALGKLATLESVVLLDCAAAAVEPPPRRRVELTALSLNSCNGACLRSALHATSAEEIEILHQAESTIDLRPLAPHHRLRKLRAGGALMRGLAHLRDKPLVELHLGGIGGDATLRDTLEALAPRLQTMSLASDGTFPPSALPPLSRFRALRRFELSLVGREHQAEWVDIAVANPRIDFRFMIHKSATKPARAKVVAFHRGVDILLVEEPKRKPIHEVSGDLAVEAGEKGNNNDLEDRVMAAAKAAKKKVIFSSEADTFVAQAADVDTCRWVIDAVLGASDGGADADTDEAPAPERAARKGALAKPASKKRGK